MGAASASPDARHRAAVALARVESGGAFAARLLTSVTPFERELVLGCLRWQLTLDAVLRPLVRHPVEELDPSVRVLLRMGAFEALRMSTPRPVAVAEAVRVAKLLAPRASGLVNAVLRKVATASWPAGPELPLPLRYSHPPWLVERWVALLGRDGAEAALAADQEPAPLCLLAAASPLDELAGSGCVLERHPAVPGVAVVRSGVEAAVRALREGRAYAIDPVAVAVARLLPEVPGTILDLAAAPGGKSLVLALERSDRRHIAADRHLGRVALLRRTLRLASRTPQVVAADAARMPLREQSCTAVLLDAPCSGSGTLRRHPEIRWRLQPDDLSRLAERQRRMIEAAARLVAPGGWLLYATCSLEPEENGEVVAGLSWEAVSPSSRLPAGLPRVTLATGGVVVPPSSLGDGFTVHLLRRGS